MKYVVIVRGRLRADNDADAEAAHEVLFAKLSAHARKLGNTGHLPVRGLDDPREFAIIDIWESLDGVRAIMDAPDLANDLAPLYDGPPEVSIWQDTGWESYL